MWSLDPRVLPRGPAHAPTNQQRRRGSGPHRRGRGHHRGRRPPVCQRLRAGVHAQADWNHFQLLRQGRQAHHRC
ncbi:hypothetical protein BSZ20_29055, partial [Bradyrhizobium canariense]